MNRRTFLTLAALSPLLAAGCVGSALKRPPVEKRYYDLEVRRSGTQAPRAGAPLLGVRRVQVSPRYEGRELVYRTGPADFASDYYNLFFVSPAQMLTQDLRQWLDRSGLFARVVDAGSLARPDLTLEANVAVFCGDYAEKPGKAVVEMQFLLLDEHSPDMAMLFSRDYRRETALAGSEPKDLVAGLRQAVSAIYADLEKDLAGLSLKAG
jgi:cholesterol transport system auxiliary component